MIALMLLLQVAARNAHQLEQSAELQGAKSNILCLAFNPSGKLLAAGEVDKRIRIWDTTTGKQVAQLEGHRRQVAAVIFSADGATLYSSSYDNSVRVWDVASGKLKEVQAGDPASGEVPAADDMRTQFNADASLLVYGSYLPTWDLKTKKGSRSDSLVVHGWFDFEGNGKNVLSVCGSEKESGKIRNFLRQDITTRKPIAQWEGTANASYERVAVSRNGATAAAIDVSGEDNRWKLEIWDVASKKRTSTPGFHTNGVNGMAFTKDGSGVATASLDKTLKFWDVATGKEVASYPHKEGCMALAVSPDGVKFATADMKVVRVWSPK